MHNCSLPIGNARIYALIAFAAYMMVILSGCNTQAPREDAPEEHLSEFQSPEWQRLSSLLPPVNSSAEAVKLGDEAVQSGQLERAIVHYVRAMQMNSDDYETLFKIGVVESSLGNNPLAVIAYRMSLDRNESYAPSHETLGLLLLKNQDYTAAREHLEQAVAIDTGRWRSHNGLGILADLRGDYVEAIRQYQTALSFRWDSPLLLSNLGYSLYLHGKLEEAQAAFEKSIQLDPEFQTGYYNLALIHARRGDYEEALNLLNANQGEAAAYNDLGYLCILLGEYERAKVYLSEAIRVSPSYYKKAGDNLLFLEQRMKAARQTN